MKSDKTDRVKKALRDTSIVQDAITAVPKWIFKKGSLPDSKHVKESKIS